jgi:hypothetical protein
LEDAKWNVHLKFKSMVKGPALYVLTLNVKATISWRLDEFSELWNTGKELLPSRKRKRPLSLDDELCTFCTYQICDAGSSVQVGINYAIKLDDHVV